jgi:hypothetical protein
MSASSSTIIQRAFVGGLACKLLSIFMPTPYRNEP